MPYTDAAVRKAYHDRYYQEHKAEASANGKIWVAANPEKRLAASRKYHEAHRAEGLARGTKYRADHVADELARHAAYRSAHRAELSSYNAAYDATHPEARAHRNAARRARKIGNGGSHTLTQWLDKLTLFANCCAYCGEAKPLERDHKIPLSRGGSDNIENIIPACRSCNASKNAKTAEEYIAYRMAA